MKHICVSILNGSGINGIYDSHWKDTTKRCDTMRKRNYELYKTPEVDSMRALICRCAELYQDKTVFKYQSKHKETISITYAQFLHDVESMGAWLIEQGYMRQKIAILGENSYSWLVVHFAATCSGNVAVPIDRDLPPHEIRRILQHSGTALLAYSEAYADEAIAASGSDIQRISMQILSECIKDGRAYIDNGDRRFMACEVEQDALAVLVYTSGTMGTSKGVMLSHRNLASDTVATCQNNLVKKASILILPLHHAFGFTAGVTCNMLQGLCIYINISLKNLSADLLEAKPFYIPAVPMIFEGMLKRIWENAEALGGAGKLKSALMISNLLRHIGIDVRRILFRKVNNAFGGELVYAVSGGGPISDSCIKGLEGFGITVINGYGLTECSPIVATNRNKSICSGSVGFPVSCNEVRINDMDDSGEGEILVRGSNVMLGYYNDPEANDEAFIDGWFRTGDLGQFDRYGNLFVTGRLKNLIVLGNGKNVHPEELEESIAGIAGVKEVLVFADNERIIAEVFPDPSMDGFENRIRDAVFALNRTQPTHKQIADIRFRNTPFEKTTTQKIKRRQAH